MAEEDVIEENFNSVLTFPVEVQEAIDQVTI